MSKHVARVRPRRAHRIGATLLVVAAAGLTGLSSAPNATATGGDDHQIEYICHPVGGAGQTGNGWTIIGPDRASSHVDLSLYPDGVYWKHEQDGRHDIVIEADDPLAATRSCPGDEPEVHGLTVAQEITTSYDTDWTWTIDKTVDKADVYLYAPAAAGLHEDTVSWTINASATSEDTDETVNGTVTVTNIGNVEDDFDLTIDPALGAVNCGGGLATAHLVVGGSVDCSWSTTSLSTADTPTVTATAVIPGLEDSEASDADAVAWGDPVNETDETVTLSDPRLGLDETLHGATGYSNSLPETFHWSDRACGTGPETNTASLSTGQYDDAVVNVHRQCQVFNGDTAWAKGTTAATTGGTYNAKKGNWATYVKGQTGTYQLFAGQTKPAGTVTIGAGGAVTVNLANGFEFAPGTGNIHIQGYSSPPSGNPSPGLFAFNKTCASSPCSPGSVTLASYYGIHLAVGVWVPDPNFGP